MTITYYSKFNIRPNFQIFTINKINDNLYLLNKEEGFSAQSHKEIFLESNEFHHGFLISNTKDEATVFLQPEESHSKVLHILIKPKFEPLHLSEDIDTKELNDNCIEKGVSVKKLLDNDRVDISGESMNMADNNDLTRLFKYLKSTPELLSTYNPHLYSSYESSLFLLSMILQNSQVKPSIIKIYCPTPRVKYCLVSDYAQFYALVIRNKDDKKYYIFNTTGFKFELLSLNEWINFLNPPKNANLCLFNLSPQVLRSLK